MSYYRQTEEIAAAETRSDWQLVQETRERETEIHEARQSLIARALDYIRSKKT